MLTHPYDAQRMGGNAMPKWIEVETDSNRCDVGTVMETDRCETGTALDGLKSLSELNYYCQI